MESVAFTITEHLAFAAFVFLHPTAVAEHLITVGPHIPKIICVDVALVVVGSDTWHYTLARFENGDFVTYDFENDPRVAEFPVKLSLTPGYYMHMKLILVNIQKEI